MMRKFPLEDAIERPVVRRQAAWRLHDVLGQVALFFPPEIVGQFVPKLEAYLLREEFTQSARVDLYVYRVISWYRNGFQLRSIFRRPVLQDWPTPPRQTLVSVSRDGLLTALVEGAAVYATQRAGEVIFYHKDPDRGWKLVHYAIALEHFVSGRCSMPKDVPVPAEGQEVLVSQDGSCVAICREEVSLFQALTNDKGFEVFSAKSHMDKQMAAALLSMVPSYDRSDLPGPESIQLYGVVPASLAAVVPYMTGFRLTQEAEIDVRLALANPQRYCAPCDGRVEDFRQVPEGCKLSIVDSSGKRFSMTLPPTFAVDDRFSADGVTVRRGEVLGYSWPLDAADGPLTQELVAVVFRDFWKFHPSDPNLRLIRMEYLPANLQRSVVVHKNGLPVVFWRVTAPAVAIKMDVCDTTVEFPAWRLNLARPEEQKAKGRKS